MLHVSNFSSALLSDIEFHLKDNENLVILGSNGAGKSTLAKLLCGLTPSTNIEIYSQKLHHLNAQKRVELINYVPPKLDIFDEYISLREYLSLSKLHSKFSVDEVLSFLELDQLQDKPCKTLSSGEQQLTMIASSILHNAKITILDEPTANLDPQKTLRMYNVLQSDKLQNKIIITHDLNLAFKLAYKILYIKDGKIDFYEESAKFFTDAHLQKLFGNAIVRVEDYFMVNL